MTVKNRVSGEPRKPSRKALEMQTPVGQLRAVRDGLVEVNKHAEAGGNPWLTGGQDYEQFLSSPPKALKHLLTADGSLKTDTPKAKAEFLAALKDFSPAAFTSYWAKFSGVGGVYVPDQVWPPKLRSELKTFKDNLPKALEPFTGKYGLEVKSQADLKKVVELASKHLSEAGTHLLQWDLEHDLKSQALFRRIDEDLKPAKKH